MSRAELSVDISRVVAKMLDGEAVDTVAAGQHLAGKYSQLGMNATAIAEAIKRTAGMMGMIREGIERAAEPQADGADGATGAMLDVADDADPAGDGPAGLPGAADRASGQPASPRPAALATSAVAALRRALFRV